MCRRGTILLGVLVLLVIGVLMAASMLNGTGAAMESSGAGAVREQARSLAWSGAQGLMAELASQRESLLRGESPTVTSEWELYSDESGGVRGVVRLIDLDPATDAFMQSESAKLDINVATAEMLARVPGLGERAAGAIVAARAGGPLASVAALAGVEGVGRAALEEPALGAAPEEPAGEGVSGEGGFTPLTALLTTFAFDPNVQSGLGDGEQFRGRPRINLDQEWSERLGQALEERLGADAVAGVKGVMDSGVTFETDAALVAALIDLGLGVEGWAMVFDIFTTSDDEYLAGRVDINRASPEVLACLPGLNAEIAAEIVRARERLSPERLQSPAWPAVEALVTPEQFQGIADYVTTRSMQWRALIEVGTEPIASDSGAAVVDEADERFSTGPEVREKLRGRMVLEVVVDVSSLRPRVACLRDVTLGAYREPARGDEAEGREDEGGERAPGEEESGAHDEAGEPGHEGAGAPDADLDLSSDLDMGTGLDLGGPEAEAPGTSPAPGGDAGSAPDGSGASESVDRRIGRWRARKGGSR